MLILKNITKDYVSGDTSVRALDDVSVSFRSSEFVSILGHSGCGKTTLLNIIGGLDRYTDGDISIKGISTKNYKDGDWDTYRNHSIGFVFQSYNLIPHQTVISNVELALTLSGVSKAERRRRAEEVLIKVGLGDQLHKKPSQMSGGQMQRVAIARALVNNPEILLADEPTGALDTDTSVQIMDILREISKDKLIIMVTHNPDLASEYSDRIIRLKDGKIIGDSNPYSIEDAEADTAAFLKAEAEKEAPSDAEEEGTSVLESAKATAAGTASASTDSAEIAGTESTESTESSESAESTESTERSESAEITDSTEGSESAETGEIPAAKKKAKKKAKKLRRPSMSFFTAISLSFNNLLTKKTRTFMTSFAGSIGIIGIALILSLSNGINAFIGRVQKETLSSYPITLQKEEMDVSSFITTFMGENAKPENADPNKIYSNNISYNLLTSMMNPATSTNNLEKFKEFLDKEDNKINEYASLIRYGYNADINAYLKNPDGSYYKADINELFVDMAVDMGLSETNASSMMGASFSSFNVWQEMLPPKDASSGAMMHDMIKEQYEIVAGKWPESKNEILLLVSSDNRITDLSLYSLGLTTKDEMLSAVMGAMNGTPIESEIQEYTYEQLLGITYKIIPTSDYYYKHAITGEWLDYRTQNASTELNGIVAGGIDLTICGIIRQNPEATAGSLSGTLIHTAALTDYLVDAVADSDIVKAQNANTAVDIFTGLPFTAPKDSLVADADKPAAFKSYIAAATEMKKAEIYKLILTTPSESDVKAGADAMLPSLGVTPTSSRDDLMGIILKYAGVGNEEIIKKYFETFTDSQLYGYIYNFALDTVRKSMTDSAQKYVDEIVNSPNAVELDAEKTKLLFGVLYTSNPSALRGIAQMINQSSGGSFNLNISPETPDSEVYRLLLSVMDAYSVSSESASFYDNLMRDMPPYVTSAVTPEIQKAYIVDHYKSITALTPSEIESQVNAMESGRIKEIFDGIVTEKAKDTYRAEKAPSQSEDSKNKKLAVALDAAIAAGAYDDTKLTAFYDEYVPQESPTTLDENYALFGSHNKKSPDYISIYPNSFEEKELIADIIEEYNNAQESEDDKISYTDYVALIMSSVTSIIDAISYVLIFFVSISLVVSSIMIGIITYISVLERAKEIGILRAMGASKRDVANVFNAETLIVGFASGMIGIIVTIILNIPIGLIIKHFSGISGIAALPPVGAVILVVISMVLTLISGLIPSRIAAKKDPVEALRSE